MANQLTARAVVGSNVNVPNNAASMSLVLLNPDGTAASTIKPQTALVDSVASTVAALVTDHNALLAKLRAAGVIAP